MRVLKCKMTSSQEKDINSSRFDLRLNYAVKELRVFFENILQSFYTAPDFKYYRFRKSLGMIRSCKHPDVKLHAEVDFKQAHFRHAYIFAYSLINSLTVYEQFSEIMIRSPRLIKSISSLMNTINLCIFGGGPAFEVVAMCKLFSNVLTQVGPSEREPLEINVTVIDICTEWEKEVRLIISHVHQELQTCNNRVTVNFNFIEADLTEEFSPDLINAFKKAHFITMNKFVSDVNKVHGRGKLFEMMHNLIESMTYKSCLFLLDFSGGNVFNNTVKIISKIPGIYEIYGPKLYHCCKLNESIVEKFSLNLKNLFPESEVKCTVRSQISCAAWMKIRNVKK